MHARLDAALIRDTGAGSKRTLQAIADSLNSMGVLTARGGKWSPMTVLRIQRRLEAMADDSGMVADEFDRAE
jgi:hypothetical protein